MCVLHRKPNTLPLPFYHMKIMGYPIFEEANPKSVKDSVGAVNLGFWT